MSFIDFGKEMVNFFGTPKPRNLTGSPASKRANKQGGSKSEDEEADLHTAFSPPQTKFLQHAVGSAFNAFAGALNTKFESLEAGIEAQAKANEELMSQVKVLQGQVADLQKSSAQKCEKPPGLSHSPSTASTVPPGTSSGRTPPEMRVVARIGNLGWDEKKEVIVKRAKEILMKAGVGQDDYIGVSATRKEGSQAELCFNSPILLQKAKFSVRALEFCFTNDKPVWLDVRKDFEELRPARIVHRITDLITEAESGRSDKLPVEKFLNGKYVKVGTDRAGYTCKGSWVWTSFATGRYDQEFRDMAKAFAEDE